MTKLERLAARLADAGVIARASYLGASALTGGVLYCAAALPRTQPIPRVSVAPAPGVAAVAPQPLSVLQAQPSNTTFAGMAVLEAVRAVGGVSQARLDVPEARASAAGVLTPTGAVQQPAALAVTASSAHSSPGAAPALSVVRQSTEADLGDAAGTHLQAAAMPNRIAVPASVAQSPPLIATTEGAAQQSFGVHRIGVPTAQPANP